MRGYPFQKIFYQANHVEDFSGLFLFLAGLLLLIIFLVIYFLIFRGLKHFVNTKIAGILSAVILVSGTVTIYHYNRDFIKDVTLKVCSTKPEIPNAKTRHEQGECLECLMNEYLRKAHSGRRLAEQLSHDINFTYKLEDLDKIKKRIQSESSLKKDDDIFYLLNASVDARIKELKAQAKFKAQLAAQRAELEARWEIEDSILESLLEANKPLTTEQINYIAEDSENWQKAIVEHNKRFPNDQLDNSGRPIKVEPTPPSIDATAKSGEGSEESPSEQMPEGTGMPATEPEPQPIEPDTP